MDHLPPVDCPFQPAVEIEYLAPDESNVPFYDNHSLDGFGAFPKRVGWDEDALIKGRLKLQCPQAVAAFVQHWLFFGLLSAFGRHLHSVDTIIQMFTRSSAPPERRVLSTRMIEGFLTDWQRTLSDADLQPDSLAQQHTDRVLIVAQRHVALYMSHGGEYTGCNPMRLYPNISFSIIALFVILSRAKLRIWPASRLLAVRHSELIMSRFDTARWCPSDKEMLSRLMTPLGMYFVSMLPPRMRHQDHVNGGCNKDSCAVMNITEARKGSYRTVHVPGCNETCGWHHVEKEELLRITTHDDTIIVVQFVNDTRDSPQLRPRLVKASGDVPFVAISHVWAEGLGHTTENALPVCQLTRIQGLVDQLPGAQGMSFWIDTMSVPQDWKDEDLTAARQVAIRRMNSVYRNAFAVLVLDAELMSVRAESSLEERLVRFVCSSWLRRLWTLNEAVLGRKVMLRFQDKAVDMIEAIFDRFGDAPGALDLSQTVLTELAHFVWRIKKLRSSISSGEKMTELWNACQYRSTSESQDEALCLAICLGHPVGPIAGGSAQANWCAFIDAQVVFPRELLFTQAKRVDHDGYRWAPESCIRRPGSEMVQLREGVGRATQHGFEVRAPGIVFNPAQGRLQSHPSFFWIKDDLSTKWYRVMKSSGTEDETWRQAVRQIVDPNKFGVVANGNIQSGEMVLGVLVAFRDDIEHCVGRPFGAVTRFLSTCNVMAEFEHVVAAVEGYHLEEMQSQALERPFCTVKGRLESDTFLWTVG